jgi:8-oxo-dGTP diphosphatase
MSVRETASELEGQSVDLRSPARGILGAVTARQPEVWLVRHACAGHRDEWIGPDDDRPLDRAGRSQALALGRELAERQPVRLVAGPSRRCVETLVPLSRDLDLDIDLEPKLSKVEEPDLAELVRSLEATGTVFCTHGEVLQSYLQELRRQDVRVKHHRTDQELLMKGAAWRLRFDPPKGLRLKLVVPIGVQSCPHHSQD